jgi:cell division protein FtsQ
VSEQQTGPAEERGPRRLARWQLVVGAVAILALLSSPLWGPKVLRTLAFFRVRRVEVLGARYTPVSEVLRRLAVDTSRSVWDPVGPLVARVQSHPQVERVEVTRKLPGTLVVEITERRPVAFTSTAAGLRAIDASGRALPLDPSRTPVDLPIVVGPPKDTIVYHLLGAMQQQAPRLFARLSSVTHDRLGEITFRLNDVSVRTMTSVTLARLADIEPVERDLARRQLRAAELDLRYRDQVIARLP